MEGVRNVRNPHALVVGAGRPGPGHDGWDSLSIPGFSFVDETDMTCYAGTGKVGFGLPFAPSKTTLSAFYGGHWNVSDWYYTHVSGGYYRWNGSAYVVTNQQGPLFQVGAPMTVEGWELRRTLSGGVWVSAWVNLGSCATDVDFTDTSDTYIWTTN